MYIYVFGNSKSLAYLLFYGILVALWKSTVACCAVHPWQHDVSAEMLCPSVNKILSILSQVFFNVQNE